MSLVVLVVRNQKEDSHAVTPEVQGKEAVKADSISQTNEEEVGIETEGNEVTAKKNILEDSMKTNAIRRYKDDNVINSYVVGRWQNIDNKGWYCVFYGEVDEYGYVGEGIMFYNRAIELQEQAQNELDDAKYTALLSQFETALKACIAPFEKAYEVTTSDNLKAGIAEYLKNACFRFRDESPEYLEKYNKYSGK